MVRVKYGLEVVQEEPTRNLTEWMVEETQSTISIHHTVSDDILIPLSVFKGDLSPLRALVFYLKTVPGFSISFIAQTLNRPYHSIWLAAKHAKAESLETDPLLVPLSAFTIPNLSIMESLVFFLQKKYSLSHIGRVLNRDPRTIWTINARVKKKIGGEL